MKSRAAERDFVGEARAAAAAGDKEGGVEGAGAKAAARAASLGLAAASTGYASLGGVHDHVRIHKCYFQNFLLPV